MTPEKKSKAKNTQKVERSTVSQQMKEPAAVTPAIDPVQLTSCLLACLNQREQDVLKRRHALVNGGKETLEAIGATYAITRERVRQIERASLSKIRRLINYRQVVQDLLNHIDQMMEKYGGMMAHHHLITELSKLTNKEAPPSLSQKINHLVFILEQFIIDFFHFHQSGDDYQEGWSKEQGRLQSVKQMLRRIEELLTTHSKPLSHHQIAQQVQESVDSIYSLLQLSKNIAPDAFGSWGLSHWPAVNPKRMSDRIYLILNKYAAPLHYKDIALHIEKHYHKKAHPPTVHNELIADSRFVLVGRGIYALREWGYMSGTVREVIRTVLAKSQKPLSREEIIAAVKKQRLVARSTILLAINSSPDIVRAGPDKFQLKELPTERVK